MEKMVQNKSNSYVDEFFSAEKLIAKHVLKAHFIGSFHSIGTVEIDIRNGELFVERSCSTSVSENEYREIIYSNTNPNWDLIAIYSVDGMHIIASKKLNHENAGRAATWKEIRNIRSQMEFEPEPGKDDFSLLTSSLADMRALTDHELYNDIDWSTVLVPTIRDVCEKYIKRLEKIRCVV